MTNLEGTVALITGAARGIGLAIARKLASRGARVIVVDLEGDAAEAVAKTLEGGKAMGIKADVGSPDSVSAMMEQVDARYGRVDILVNNAAAGGRIEPFLEMRLDNWERSFRVNLTGAFLVGQSAARWMVASGDGGAIVNVSSVSGQRGSQMRAAYGSSKAGLELLTRVMAVELAPYGIRVNAVAPGPIELAPGRFWHNDAEREAYINMLPMRRFGTAEEVADCVLFLVSDESRYVTGHVLNVDGGMIGAGLMTRTAPAA